MRSEDHLRLMQFTVDWSGDGVAWVDADGRFMYVNEILCCRLAYTRDELLTRSIVEVLGPPLDTDWAARWTHLRERGVLQCESWQRRKDGETFPVDITVNSVDCGGTACAVVYMRDIAGRRQGAGEAAEAATRDVVTGLRTRDYLIAALDSAVAGVRQNPGQKFALVLLDVDRFRLINDSLGHRAGDLLLRRIARRLEQVTPAGQARAAAGTPQCLLARAGGDEIGLLLPGVGSAEDLATFTRRLERAIARPFRLGDEEVLATVSIGSVLAGAEYECGLDAFRDADAAVYHAKRGGRARNVAFDRGMHEHLRTTLVVERDLRRGIHRREFYLAYQPVVSLDSGALCGFEALLRWQHPERGCVPPDQFIGLAEETGLIVPIGEWVLLEACQRLLAWQQRWGPAGPFISVNLSKKQLLVPGFFDGLQEVIQTSGIQTRRLKLEVTESAIVEHSDAIVPGLRQLQQLGVELLMDDFGTGHSSLSRLHEFPIDAVKVDRAFVAMSGNRQLAAIMHAILTLARNLRMRAIAEGVETQEQIVQLLALGCEFAQGYYFAKPLPLAEAERLIAGPLPWLATPATEPAAGSGAA